MIEVKLLLLLTILNSTVFLNSWTLGEIQEFDSTAIWDHPWMIDVTIEHLVGNRKFTFHCVGALLHERAVITSGMCLNRSSPSSEKTLIRIHSDVLDSSRQATEERHYSMANITYHNFESKYNSKKFDIGLVFLYEKIIHDAENQQAEIISVATQKDIEYINFSDCFLTSITTHLRKKTQVPFRCRLTSYLLSCTPKDNDLIGADSGSSLICKKKNNQDSVLVGFLTGYNRLKLQEGHKMMPIYTSLIAVGHNLTYNLIDSFIQRNIT